MKFFIATIAILFSSSAFSMEVTTPSDESIEEMKELVLEFLKDPSSAQFRKFVEATGNGKYIRCGQVNAKNGFGGYTGWTNFVYDNANDDAAWEFTLQGKADLMCPVMFAKMDEPEAPTQ